MRPRTALLFALTSSLVFTASCSSTTAGQPDSAKPSSSTSNLPKDGAPAVSTPLTNTASVEADPCSAVSTAQVESIGGKVKDTEKRDLSLGTSCTWIFDDGAGTISAGMSVGNKDGLSSLYYQSTHGGLTTFKPVPPIEGLPAVIYANGSEGTDRCTLAIGVRDDLLYTINNQLRGSNPYVTDPCGLNTKFAELAIQRLKGA